MSFIEWSILCETGIIEIDKQHKFLVQLINQLSESLNGNINATQNILSELVNYTAYHFGAEEELMRNNDYPDLPDHKQEHVLFIRKVIEFHTLFLKKKANLNIEILNFLKNWLINHILGTDKKFANFIINK